MNSNTMQAQKAEKLAEQWPKKCNCCATVYDPSSWVVLPTAVTSRAPDGRFVDSYATQEMRNCLCGSTLVSLVEIHDLSEE
jgi:hypothetical protein